MNNYEYAGMGYGSRRLMCLARRNHYVELLRAGLSFTQAARTVGVSKRTGKVWRNGRTRTSGRNETPVIDWYRHNMDSPKTINSRYLSQPERIGLADGLLVGESLRTIALRMGRNVSSLSREVHQNMNPETGRYEPYLAQQLSSARLHRPKPAKITKNPELLTVIRTKLDKHWSPEQISVWLKSIWADNETMNVNTETIYQAIYVQAKGQLKLGYN